jgi:hypothetical protein
MITSGSSSRTITARMSSCATAAELERRAAHAPPQDALRFLGLGVHPLWKELRPALPEDPVQRRLLRNADPDMADLRHADHGTPARIVRRMLGAANRGPGPR